MARGSSTRKSSTSSNILNTTSISPSPDSQFTMAGRKNARRNPQAEIVLPVTYTPTTHRISKAKKGKRVHACEFPGCSKVFTRAEHRRRHELNHNPEASYRCTHHGCKKAFHRPDLLARHMERHELESQPQPQSQWAHTQLTDSSSIPCCFPSNTASLVATSQHSQPISIGSLVAPGVHLDLHNEYSMGWNGMDLPLQQPRPVNMFQNQLPETTDDSPFYSSPAETCPSPLSDVAYSLPSHSGSSVSSMSSISSSLSVIDQYPKGIYKSDLSSSPLHMDSPLRWDSSDNIPPHMIPLSLDESLIQPPICHYPSPSWSTDYLPYDDQVHSLAQFQPISWKQWM
ncbi:Zinc finger C2H2 [Penicillium taxi]|uniref:Zinc finger C2H2 n=1 Tax=Penicillium taxi TaxID=168475 RepID=UPI002545565F|nr:Zinc finger C2H2 [Penicillium taxi]KAJ5898893.1 Zinc finger C2H2 [Penicillium taxi]